MSDSAPLSLHKGVPETVLPPPPTEWLAELSQALAQPPELRRDALARVAASFPRYLDAWAHLAEAARDSIEAYAYARVGYHRGLDALRAAGWKGSGYVRWRDETNRGFLRALNALRTSAEEIGEVDEAERCAMFLRQLDPTLRSDLPPA